MSKLMLILGAVVTAAAILIGLLIYVQPGQMQVLGVTPEVSAVLLVGGLGLIGISAVITALERSAEATVELRQWLAGHDLAAAGEPGIRTEVAATAVAAESVVAGAAGEEEPARSPIFGFGRKSAEATDRPAEPDAGAQAEDAFVPSKVSAADTIADLEKAKEDISRALGGAPDQAETPKEEGEAAAPADELPEEIGGEEPSEEEQLYVVEEKLIRGRPARVLSDGTVEAETDEGWMRFENHEHLEEYLDAMSPERT